MLTSDPDDTGRAAGSGPEAVPEAATPATPTATVLATLLRRLTRLEARVTALAVALADAPPGEHLPDACRRRACTYFQYLASGDWEEGILLAHGHFHRLEREAEAHMRSCTWDWSKGECKTCARWQRQLKY